MRVSAVLVLAVPVLVAALPSVSPAADPHAAARGAMVRTIAGHARQAARHIGRQALDPMVMQVMGQVPRHEFVPGSSAGAAYGDHPLPIGYGQTISQPFIVALMTDLLEIGPGDAVLEVGTGSGYQAAVLDAVGARVATVEIIPELAGEAAERLKRLGYERVEVRTGDGYFGWEEKAPFAAIIVTAAATHIPPPLVEQLAPGGRMVIPVGPPFLLQYLMLVEKDAGGEVSTRSLLPVSFVPLTGSHEPKP